jgi:hypothetical protein
MLLDKKTAKKSKSSKILYMENYGRGGCEGEYMNWAKWKKQRRKRKTKIYCGSQMRCVNVSRES